jgi:hypothetical protein
MSYEERRQKRIDALKEIIGIWKDNPLVVQQGLSNAWRKSLYEPARYAPPQIDESYWGRPIYGQMVDAPHEGEYILLEDHEAICALYEERIKELEVIIKEGW